MRGSTGTLDDGMTTAHNGFVPDPHTPAANQPARLWKYWVLFVLVLFGVFAAGVALTLFGYAHIPKVGAFAALIVASLVTAWVFGLRHKRALTRAEEWRLSGACFVPYWALDVLLPLAYKWISSPSFNFEPLQEFVATLVALLLTVLVMMFMNGLVGTRYEKRSIV